jgi:transposase InsO family protein
MRRKKNTGKGKRKKPAVRLRNGRRYTRPQSFQIKKKAVKLFLEEGLPADLVAEEVGVCHGTVFAWAKVYREQGEEGLKPKGYSRRTKNISPVVKEKISAVKKDNPTYGAKRISQVVKRLFCIKASPDVVSKTLKQENLQQKPKKKRRKPKPKVRSFERAKPNQMWQSDITTFLVLGRTAYLIAFMDDHSRYIVSWGLFRSQRAEQVIEVYRDGVGQYGVPKEVLTDNGRQYASWRGKSKFTKELTRDDVHHIRSTPHHPKTLGKIERFWKSIKDELISNAVFERFEEARERIGLWVKYYNHQRPHQGIDGACPADRFFQIQKQLREVIEKGVEENAEQIALHGRAKSPFYMVGRVGEKSVVITKDGDEMKVDEVIDEPKTEETGKERGNSEDEDSGQDGTAGVQCPGEGGSGPFGVVGEAEAEGSMQGDADQLDNVEPVAGRGAFGDAGGSGAEGAQGGGTGACPGTETGEAFAEETAAETGGVIEGGAASDKDPGGEAEGDVAAGNLDIPLNGYALLSEGEVPIVRGVLTEHTRRMGHEWQGRPAAEGTAGAQAGGPDSPGAEQTDNRIASGEVSWGESQDVLPMGEEVPVRGDGGGTGEERRSPGQGGGRGEGGTSTPVVGTGEASEGVETCGADPGSPSAAGTGASWTSSEETERQACPIEAGAVGSEQKV